MILVEMNEYRNILTGESASAFKKLIGRFYWADGNIVVKHLIAVHERFCGTDCTLERSKKGLQESEKGNLGISPEESNVVSPQRSEAVQRVEECHTSSENPEKSICLHMEVEDGTESVDDDSSGESESDTKSGEKMDLCNKNSNSDTESGENQPPKRFKASAENSKRTMQWGIKIFQDWHEECFNEELDLRLVTPAILSNLLCRFYCEVRPKPTCSNPQETFYQRKTLLGIRSALNHHLSDLGRQIDIVKGEEFHKPNGILEGLFSMRIRLGLSKAAGHAKLMDRGDLEKISIHLQGAYKSRVILRQAVWYLFSIHFVTRSTRFHQHLKINSFEFQTDENGEYAIVKNETLEKKHSDHRVLGAHIHKRIYALESDNGICPVKLLKLLIKKTDNNATLFFNQYSKEISLGAEKWYSASPLQRTTFTSILPKLCRDAGVNKKYSFQCLRETAITYVNDQGLDPQHVMNIAQLHDKDVT
ncbi:uncharacterized protein LOC133198585 [Saccostrea echinata]|uniref:uncharacterized protein LOC133198585 n=1 Tax=Saccostrea echinata TaxID=191078 RepID=UPI002A8311DA|nr:uncharacterized protein LOC133198585 [Saccostrea echinata]